MCWGGFIFSVDNLGILNEKRGRKHGDHTSIRNCSTTAKVNGAEELGAAVLVVSSVDESTFEERQGTEMEVQI